MNILLSCIGKRSYIAEYFRHSLPEGGKIIGTSNTNWTPGFSSCDISIVLPPIASDEYVPALLSACKKYEVSGILSLFDPDVHRLSAHREEFARAGVVPVFPGSAASKVAFDKLETWRFMTQLGIAVPLTTDEDVQYAPLILILVNSPLVVTLGISCLAPPPNALKLLELLDIIFRKFHET